MQCNEIETRSLYIVIQILWSSVYYMPMLPGNFVEVKTKCWYTVVWDRMTFSCAFVLYLCIMWSSVGATTITTATTTTTAVDRANAVANYWSVQANISRHNHHHKHRVSWWQSPVIMAEVRRRATGDENTTFAQYFKSEMVIKQRAGRSFQNGLSLGSGHGIVSRK